MASRYEGRIKYLGEDSYTMEFKLAFLLLEEDCAKWLLRSFLCCKPEQVYKSHEIYSTTEVDIKGSRLLVKHLMNSKFWELHFIPVNSRLNHDLCNKIKLVIESLKSKTKSGHCNRAEVGLKRKPTISPPSPNKVVIRSDEGRTPESIEKITSSTGRLPMPTNGDRELSLGSKIGFYSSNLEVSRLGTPKTIVNSCRSPYTPSSQKMGGSEMAVSAKQKLQSEVYGFPNFGNSCFLNSSLQALCAILPFKSDLQFLSRYVDSRHHSSLIMLLSEGMKFSALEGGLHTNDGGFLKALRQTISKKAPHMAYGQQDAHEFLDHILDQLKDEVNVLSKCSESIDCGGCGKGGDYASPSTEAGSSGDSVSKYDPAGCNFMLDIVTRYECQRCHFNTESRSCMNYLSVAMPGDVVGKKLPGLQCAIDDFLRSDTVEFTCERCGEKCEALATSQVARLPRVLVLHLKRFAFKGESCKVQTQLCIPSVVSLRQHCDSHTKPHLPFDAASIRGRARILTKPNVRRCLDIYHLPATTPSPSQRGNNSQRLVRGHGVLSDSNCCTENSGHSTAVDSDRMSRLPANTLTFNTDKSGTPNVLHMSEQEQFEYALRLSLGDDDNNDGEEKENFDPGVTKQTEVASDNADALHPGHYRLVAVIHHYGQSAYVGHYLCDVLDIGSSQWFRCNDSHISRALSHDVNFASRKNGYIFFYLNLQIFNNIKKVISSGTVNPPTSKTTPSYESHFPYPSPVYDMAHTPDNEEMDLTCREECFTEGDDADDIF